MDIVIFNMSRLRVALNKYVKANNERSVTACLVSNGFSSSFLAKSERRFDSMYKDKVTFKIDEYVSYGAVYLDSWEQLKKSFGFKAEEFELERISAVSTCRRNSNAELETRILNLENKFVALAKTVEELRRNGGKKHE